jgi:hypothetical protein
MANAIGAEARKAYMKTLFITISILFTVISAVVIATLLMELKENRDLRRENQKLWADLHATKSQAEDLEEEKSEATTKLAAKHGEVQALEAKLGKAEADAQNAKTNGAAAGAQPFRPYQVRAFVGNRLVGRAWVLPSNVTKDPKTGQVNFEPVVVLEEASKKAFTETNYVERDVVRYSTLNYNYNPYPYYWYYYPYYSYRPGLTNVPPIMPPNNNQPTPSGPVSVRPLVSGGAPWTPFTIQGGNSTPQTQPGMPQRFGRTAPAVPTAQAAAALPSFPTRR